MKTHTNDHFQPDVNLVTALVPSKIACFANSPGKSNLTLDCSFYS